MSALNFWKYQATGNDFVLLNARDLPAVDISTAAMRLCDRRFGVGADQLLILHEATDTDSKLEVRNADGSLGEMCGNGIRAVARHLQDQCGPQEDFAIQTHGRTVAVRKSKDGFATNLGPPGAVNAASLQIGNERYRLACVSMGNPHAIVQCHDVSAIDIHREGPPLERHEHFANGSNIHFVTVTNTQELRARSWERGSGPTLACGSGAAAIAVVCATRGWTERNVAVQFPGGTLQVRWNRDNNVWVSGPAECAFAGQIDPSRLR